MQFFWSTKKNKFITKKEVEKIVIAIGLIIHINKKHIIEYDKSKCNKYNINLISKKATSLESLFTFYTEYGKDKKKLTAERLVKPGPGLNILSISGKLELNSVISKDSVYEDIIKGILEIIQDITDKKLEIKTYTDKIIKYDYFGGR